MITVIGIKKQPGKHISKGGQERTQEKRDISIDLGAGCNLEYIENNDWLPEQKRLEEKDGIILNNLGLGNEGTSRIMHERPNILSKKDAVLVIPRDKHTYGECVE